MKRLKLISLISFCILLSTFSQVQVVKQISKTFPKLGITVSLPDNWEYVDGSENMKNKLFKSYYKEPENKTPYNTISVSISYEIMKTQVPADTAFNQIRRAIKSQVINNVVIENAVNKIQGRPTRSFQYNFSINEFEMTTISTYFIEQNVLFCFNTTVYTNKLEEYKQLINLVSSSIQIGKLDPSLFTNSYEYKKFESRYINKKYGFEIDFPIGWFYLEDIMSNAVQIKKPNQDSEEVISMGINVQEDYDKKMTLIDYNQNIVRALKNQLIPANKDEKIISNMFPHPAFEAYKAHFTSLVNNKKQIVFIYTTIKNKKGYLFIATTDEKHLVENEILFDKTFKSMTIK